jgi:hypothetical protein
VTAPCSGVVPQRRLLLDGMWRQHTRSSTFGASGGARRVALRKKVVTFKCVCDCRFDGA